MRVGCLWYAWQFVSAAVLCIVTMRSIAHCTHPLIDCGLTQTGMDRWLGASGRAGQNTSQIHTMHHILMITTCTHMYITIKHTHMYAHTHTHTSLPLSHPLSFLSLPWQKAKKIDTVTNLSVQLGATPYHHYPSIEWPLWYTVHCIIVHS